MHRAVVIAHLQVINAYLRRTLSQSALSTVSNRNGVVTFPESPLGSWQIEHTSIQHEPVQSNQGSVQSPERAVPKIIPAVQLQEGSSQARPNPPVFKRYTSGTVRRLAQSIRVEDIEGSWKIFQDIVNDHPKGAKLIPTHTLHFLVVLLATPKLKTRQTFLRTLAVVMELRRRNARRVRSWQWGALMDASAKGHRATTWEDYLAALGILTDWESLWMGASELLSRTSQSPDPKDVGGDGSTASKKQHEFRPNIIAHITLIAIASRTRSQTLLHDALLRLDDFRHGRPSRPPPQLGSMPHAALSDNINALSTHDNHEGIDPASLRLLYLSRIPYYTKKHQPQHVVSILACMIHQGLDIGVDGVNAAMWCFAFDGEVDIARGVYDVLRANIRGSIKRSTIPDGRELGLWKQSPEQYAGAFGNLHDNNGSIASTETTNPILEIPGLISSLSNVKPNHITYSSLVQAYCYHNRFEEALRIFQEYLGEISTGHFLFESLGQSVRKPSIGTESLEQGSPEGLEGDVSDCMEATSQRVFGSGKSTSVEELVFVSFRAVIQGFIKHGVDPGRLSSSSSNHFAHVSLREASVQALMGPRSFIKNGSQSHHRTNAYTLSTLLDVFHVLMSLPCSPGSTPFIPPHRFYQMVLIAFQTVSGNDKDIMNAVFEKLVKDRLRRIGEDEDDEEAKKKLLRIGGWKKLKKAFWNGGTK